MCHVTIVELIKLKLLLDFLFIDTIEYKKYKIIDISQFSFLAKFLCQKWFVTTLVLCNIIQNYTRNYIAIFTWKVVKGFIFIPIIVLPKNFMYVFKLACNGNKDQNNIKEYSGKNVLFTVSHTKYENALLFLWMKAVCRLVQN